MAYITLNRSLVAEGAPFREMHIDAIGSTIKFLDEENVYFIFDKLLDPAKANLILTNAPDSTITDYNITRYTPVDDLAASLPVVIPQSVVEEEDEEPRQLTYQEVFDMDTTHAPLVDGIYYFNLMAHSSHRPITLDEYNMIDAAGVILIKGKDVPHSVEDPLV